MVSLVRKFLIYIGVVISLTQCTPPIPFMEEFCLPPVANDDIKDGRVRATTVSNIIIRANGLSNTITKEYRDMRGNLLQIQVPDENADISPWVTNSFANADPDSNITIKSISGYYFTGPNLFTKPENGDYEQAYATGEYSAHKGGYIGKRILFHTEGPGDFIGVAPIYDPIAKVTHHSLCRDEDRVHFGDLITITILKAGEEVYFDKTKLFKITTVLNAKNEDWIKNKKEYAREINKDEDEWIRQTLARHFVYCINGSCNWIVGNATKLNADGSLSLAENSALTEDYRKLDQLSDDDKADYLKPYYETRQRIAHQDGCLTFKKNLTNDWADIDPIVYVRVLRNKVNITDSNNGVEMAIVNCDSTTNPKGCDPNINTDLLSNAERHENLKESRNDSDRIHTDSGGRIWMQIKEKPDTNLTEYEGSISVNVETKGFSEGAAKLYMPIIRTVKEHSQKAMQTMFKGIVKDTGFATIVISVIILWMAVIGVKFTMGLEQMSASEVAMKLTKLGIVVTLISPNSWDVYSYYFFEGILSIPGFLAKAIDTDRMFGNRLFQDNPFFFLDNSLALMFHPEVVGRTFAILLSPAGILVFAVVVWACITFLKGFFRALVMYIFSILLICMLLAISPFFIPFLLFKYEMLKDKFEKYMTIVLRVALEPGLLVIGLYVINQIFLVLYTNFLMNLHLCFKCAFPIELNLGPLGYIPFVVEIERMICFWGFMAWGADNFGGFLGIAVMLIKYFIPALTILIITMVFDGYVTFVSNLAQTLTQVFLSGGLGNVGAAGSQGGAFAAADSLFGGMKTIFSETLSLGKILGGRIVGDVQDRMARRNQGRLGGDGLNNNPIDSLRDKLGGLSGTNNIEADLKKQMNALSMQNDMLNDRLNTSNLHGINNDSFSPVFSQDMNSVKRGILENKAKYAELVEKLSNGDIQGANTLYQEIQENNDKLHDSFNGLISRANSKLSQEAVDARNERYEFEKQKFEEMTQKGISNVSLDQYLQSQGEANYYTSLVREENLKEEKMQRFTEIQSTYTDNFFNALDKEREHFDNLHTLYSDINDAANDVNASEKIEATLEKVKSTLEQKGVDDSYKDATNVLDEMYKEHQDTLFKEEEEKEYGMYTDIQENILEQFKGIQIDANNTEELQNTFENIFDSLRNEYGLTDDQAKVIKSGLFKLVKETLSKNS